jgi:ATP phosphoribosyltransferase-like protein
MKIERESSNLKLALPKGRMQEGVFRLLADAGIRIQTGARGYRPTVSFEGIEAKILKPQTIVELLDTGLDPVRLAAAAPAAFLVNGDLPPRRLVVASEYERLTRAWIERRRLDATFVRSFGATEVFPPEDADVIVDNTATGQTLDANGLQVVDELMRSSTRMYASPRALEDPVRRKALERLVLLIRGVIDARGRVLVEANVPADRLEAVIAALPCMREPTVAPLHGGAGYAVKAAVPRAELARVIPEIKARGASDILVTAPSQIVA